MYTLHALAEVAMAAPQPVITLTVDAGLKALFQKIAVFLIIAWVVYIIMQYAMPSKRSAKIKWGRVFVMGIGSIVLLDITVLVKVANGFITVMWSLMRLIAPTWFA